MPYLEMECPEGHGDTTITVTLKDHSSSRGPGIVDRVAILRTECDIHDDLLEQDKNCNWSCKETEEYRQFKKSVEV